MRALGGISGQLDALEERCRDSDRRTERLHGENRRSLEDLGRDIRSLADAIRSQGAAIKAHSSPIGKEAALWIGIGLVLGRAGWLGLDQFWKLAGLSP